MTQPLPFWKTKTLAEMTPDEWESLCDGCGLCCLFRLEDEDTGEIYTTNVICRLFDPIRCRCTEYTRRTELVPTCLVLTPELVPTLRWMPKSCAYRRLSEGRELAWWHPLVSGRRESVHEAGISPRDLARNELEADMDNLEEYIVEWFDHLQNDE